MEIDKKESNQLLVKQFNKNTRNLKRASSLSHKVHRRLILKNGITNVLHQKQRHQHLAFLEFTKLMNSSWSWIIIVFSVTLMLSWCLFGVIWWVICYTHGDFEPNHLPPHQKQNNFKPCIYNMYNFASCLQFSIETQHTVGYGTKATSEECPEAIFVNTVQSIIGFIMQGFMAAVMFAKMTQSKLRTKTLLFSKNATITYYNQQLCLMFRIGDMRKSYLTDVNIRTFFIRTQCTNEGEILQYNQFELDIITDNSMECLFFNWPLIIIHPITLKSPLYHLSSNDLRLNCFEIVAVLEGVICNTGQITQAKTSYLSIEIQWGKSFTPLMEYDYCRNQYKVDFSKFDKLVSTTTTPLSSAAYLNEQHIESSTTGSSIRLTAY